MRKCFKIAVFAITAVCIITTAYAKDDKVGVNFSTDELAFSINVLNTIELRGDEVTPFIDIKNLLMDVYKDVSSGKKKTAEVAFTMPMAKNFLFFIQRAKLKGAEAAIFNDINTKMVDAIKKESKD
jgi:hypothetical protein